MNFYLAMFGAKETAKQRGIRLRKERLSAARALSSHSKIEWEELVKEFDGKCVRCGVSDNLQKDHIVPIYQGGSDGIDNIQPLCRKCNTHKGPDSFNWILYRRSNPFVGESNG